MAPPPRRAGALRRLVKSADFERVLRVRSAVTSAHFAVHHLPLKGTGAADLSTSGVQLASYPVDDLCVIGPTAAVAQLGAVVPKRHARRAVTRSLLKRQIYVIAARHLSTRASGLWVVRLRAPFARTEFPSAASRALRLCVRTELESLFDRLPAPAEGP